jgi:hypothetical protein
VRVRVPLRTATYVSPVPSAVSDLLAAAGLASGGCVAWGEPVPETGTGVYVVSLTSATDRLAGALEVAPISRAALEELDRRCPNVALDGLPSPDAANLAARLGSFWLADECVRYIGLAGQPLRTRVRQYYRTPLGAAKPHEGGWWLKTLSVLEDLHVHYATTADYKEAEEEMLRAFAAGVSPTSRAALPEGEPLMPFANLRDGRWRRRNHGITGATNASERSSATGSDTGARTPSTRLPATSPSQPSRAIGVTPHHRSQRVTDKDIAAGQVRVPRGATKTILPSDRCDIAVRVRGSELSCRWDPRYGPPERSGLIRVGRAAARDLLRVDEVLAVSIAPDGAVVLQ